jgi:citrate synthase
MSEPRPWIGAADAAQLLGVTRATLYAYVSRGLIRSQARPGLSRERAYSRDDVERMRRRTEERRAPDKAAAGALRWGIPILESAITLIDGRRLYYRGQDAAVLARSRSLEEVAALIWTGQFDRSDLVPGSLGRLAASARALPFVGRAQTLLATAAARDAAALDFRPSAVARTGFAILRLLTSAGVAAGGSRATTDAALARAWTVGRGLPILRAALVLSADHELNVSSFTARCVASAGSHPYAVVIAGLAALEGPKHGGASARVESMLAAVRTTRGVRAALDARVRRGQSIDGFGHPLYRGGDPRARVLLEMLAERYGRSGEFRFITDCARAGSDVTGEHPNLDFALVAVARVLALPPGAPLILFAIGRSVGWVGHAIEQYATGLLIRPRATYVGIAPALPAGEVG